MLWRVACFTEACYNQLRGACSIKEDNTKYRRITTFSFHTLKPAWSISGMWFIQVGTNAQQLPSSAVALFAWVSRNVLEGLPEGKHHQVTWSFVIPRRCLRLTWHLCRMFYGVLWQSVQSACVFVFRNKSLESCVERKIKGGDNNSGQAQNKGQKCLDHQRLEIPEN